MHKKNATIVEKKTTVLVLWYGICESKTKQLYVKTN